MMKPKVKLAWVEALRSGEYTQGSRALKKSRDGVLTHCCLGVLCELAVQASVIAPSKLVEGFYPYMQAFDGDAHTLPLSVRRWAGLSNGIGVLPNEDAQPSLAEMNDEGATFEEIANKIEERF